MSDISSLRQNLEASQDQFENFRVSVTPIIEDRGVGELTRALHSILPDLAFHEGQAAAAGTGLGHLDAGDDVSVVSRALATGLLEHQAARQSNDFLAGFAKVLATVNRAAAR
ncbi:hypothetical protein [Rhodococcus sp. IEGM 1408]|uniref:hypothetical protein n=1 Tax=Rhodococcus sp. IEGM 1408 TaxID=3082220 RepID=UPI002953262B|nr:hypothetical protein [Rhodococcus sp. IEGM 1408]MDV7999984.1 hypothetical protein [Rhodococcus sp. IEGM 1408]